VKTVNDDANVGRRIVSGGVWRLLAFGFAALLGVVATAVISRRLGPADFALYTTAISLIALATTVPDVGLVALGVREYASHEGAERIRGQRALITLRLAFSAVGTVAILLWALIDDYPAELVAGLAVAGVGICVLSLYVSFCVPIQATYRLGTMAVLEALRQVLIAGMMIAAVLVTAEPGFVVSVYLPASLILALASGLIVRRFAPVRPSLDFAAMRELLRRVSTFAIAGSVGGVYAYAAQVLSNSILTPHDSGMFGLVFRVYAVLLGACMTAVGGAFPLLVTASREDRERLGYASRRLFQTTFLAGVACTVGLVAGSAFVVAVIGGPDFADADGVLQVVALAMPWSFVLVTGGSYLLAADHHRALVMISAGGALASIVLTAGLTVAFGLYGTAAGLVIGEFVIATSYVLKIAQLHRVALATPRWTLAVLAAGAVSCLPALLGLPSVVEAAIALALFAVLALVLRLVPPELTERLPLIGAGS
jgi:O-antigen/teichoic acid export membrane protein